MIRDIATVMWKERRERAGARRGLQAKVTSFLFPALTFGIMAIIPPLAVGPAWTTSPFSLLASVFLPFMAAMSTASDAVVGERERKTLETLLASRLPDPALLFGKMAVPVVDGLAAVVLAHVVSLLVLNVAHGEGGLLLYAPPFVLLLLALALLVALFVSSLGVLLSLRARTVQQASLNFMVAFMAPFVLALGTAYLTMAVAPEAWSTLVGRFVGEEAVRIDLTRTALLLMGTLALIDLALLALAVHRFQRPRLRLD